MKKLILLSIILVVGCEETTAPEPEDCAGVAGGDAVEDDCGVCTGIADYVAGTCYDCADTPNGDALEDNCGTCDNDSTNDCTADCNGDFGGNALEDECDTCDNDSTNDCVKDCADVWGGTAVEDCTGVCGGTHLDSDCGTITDIDGNAYATLKIGEQVWMTENLKVTHYDNGDAIQYVKREEAESGVWINLITGAYGIYNDDDSSTYQIAPHSFPGDGNLYNWYAVNDNRGICSEGWHIPTEEEYTELINFLGGESVAGRKMKKTNFWHQHNQYSEEATNESGFTALPAGERNQWGLYYDIYKIATFWTANSIGNVYARLYKLSYENSNITSENGFKPNGCSVRCIKD